MTKVSPKCGWEYCLYIDDNEFGYYKKDGSKVSKPFGMLAEKTFGDSGQIKVKIAKSLLNNFPAIRYTISSFAPSQPPNFDTLYQGGSSAADVFPGTPATFGGEINGYGEISGNGILSVTTYTIYYVYDGINPIIEYSPGGSILNRYIYAGGMHIARVSGADTNWYHCDALGSPRKMTNEMWDGVWSATYYPFGEATTSGTNTHQFTGKEMDSEMGLNYFCQRYYDPQIGRFMTLDPQDSPASSPYAYCANNSLRRLDPLGTSWDDFQGALYREFIPWDFSEEQWSWIEQNMSRIDKSERLAQRAGMFFAKSAQMDPDFWDQGWEKTHWDKIHEAMNYLKRTEWGQGIGKDVVAKLLELIATGKVDIQGGFGSLTNWEISDHLILGTFDINAGVEVFSTILAHEGAHQLWHPAIIRIPRDELGSYTWKYMSEGIAMLYEASYIGSENAVRNCTNPFGWISRGIFLLESGWQNINQWYPDLNLGFKIFTFGKLYYGW